jgi:spore germination cell wall hydrolase CwlJ-like protein
MSILNFKEWSIRENVEINSTSNASYIKGVKDSEIIAATIIGEAGGEPYNGMQAIKNVLDNRANDKGTSAAGEALRPKQFSMWNKATANVSNRSDYKSTDVNSIINLYRNHDKWSSAIKLATSKPKDITKNATLYYAHNKIKPPYWTEDWTKTAVIANHTFGKLT